MTQPVRVDNLGSGRLQCYGRRCAMSLEDLPRGKHVFLDVEKHGILEDVVVEDHVVRVCVLQQRRGCNQHLRPMLKHFHESLARSITTVGGIYVFRALQVASLEVVEFTPYPRENLFEELVGNVHVLTWIVTILGFTHTRERRD